MSEDFKWLVRITMPHEHLNIMEFTTFDDAARYIETFNREHDSLIRPSGRFAQPMNFAYNPREWNGRS
jgi:hypothetical protein